MTVHFIGAGPGAADLLTLRGQRLISGCAVCVYAGSIVCRDILAYAPPDARLIDTQDLTLDQIIEELRAAHGAGADVARLQSGDLSIYSAVAEQTRRLDALGIPWDLTPGVPAFAAAAAALRQELTLPGVAQTVILARYGRESTPIPEGEQLPALASHRATLAIHLGAQAIGEIVDSLEPAYGADCPVAVVAHAAWSDERIVRGTLATIVERVREADISRTAMIFVGPALAPLDFGESHLYSDDRERPGAGGPVR